MISTLSCLLIALVIYDTMGEKWSVKDINLKKILHSLPELIERQVGSPQDIADLPALPKRTPFYRPEYTGLSNVKIEPNESNFLPVYPPCKEGDMNCDPNDHAEEDATDAAKPIVWVRPRVDLLLNTELAPNTPALIPFE